MNRLTSRLLRGLGAAAASIGLSTSLAAHDLYWTEYSTDPNTAVIRASDIDGENAVTIFETTELGTFIVDIAVTEDHIYFSGHNNGSVWRADRDGQNATAIITAADTDPEAEAGLLSVHNITVDAAGGKLYIACHTNGIFSADLDGSNLKNLFGVVSGWPGQNYSGVTLKDPDQLLWNNTMDNNIYIQDRDVEPFPSSVFVAGGTATYGLAHNPDTDIVYYTVWAGGSPSNLYSYHLQTNENLLLRDDLVGPLGLKLSPSRTHLLIAQRGVGISAYQLDNEGYALIVPAPAGHFGVAVTADPGELDPPPPPPPPAEDGDTVFFADFSFEQPGDAPATAAVGGPWAVAGTSAEPTEGTVTVMEDTQNLFGMGTDNRFLRFEGARGYNLRGNFESNDVNTIKFDYIGRYNLIPGRDPQLLPRNDANRWVNLSPRAEGQRASLLSLRKSNNTIRTDNALDHSSPGPTWPTPNGFEGPVNPSYGANNIPLHFAMITNNQSVWGPNLSYEGPDGETYELAGEHATVWVYNYNTGVWTHALPEFQYARQSGADGNLMDNIYFQIDSNDPLRSFDIDNVQVVKGAHIGEPTERQIPRYLRADFEVAPEVKEDVLTTIIRNHAGHFVHGNLTSITFHSQYDASGEERPPLLIASDTENNFGKGPENKVLRTNKARGWNLNHHNAFEEEIVTLRIDMIHNDRIGGGRLTSRFFDAEGNVLSRLEFDSSGQDEGFFRTTEGTWAYHQVNRFEAVLNNSAEPLAYTAPNGSGKTLIPGGTDIWINGQLADSDSLDGRPDGDLFGPATSYTLLTFSTNPWDADIDLVHVYPGVNLVATDAPETGYEAWAAANFPGITDESIIGPGADFSGNGVPNLIHYALRIDPNSTTLEGLPTRDIQDVDGVDYLTLTFTTDDSADDLTIEVLVAGSVDGQWTAYAVEVSSTPNGDGTTTRVYRDSVPASGADRRFILLSVGLN